MQLFILSITSNGLINNKPYNNLQANAPDATLIEADSCSEIAQWDTNYGAASDVFPYNWLIEFPDKYGLKSSFI